jgi:hypothetical protein
LHGFVILVKHQLMQDAGGLMGAPVRVDIGPVYEKKVGNLEVVVDGFFPTDRMNREANFSTVDLRLVHLS